MNSMAVLAVDWKSREIVITKNFNLCLKNVFFLMSEVCF